MKRSIRSFIRRLIIRTAESRRVLSEYMNRKAVSDTMACYLLTKDDPSFSDYSKAVTASERGAADQEAKAEDIGAWMEIGADECTNGISSCASSRAQD
ncbi:hypothetical protein OIU74_024131 [Salix koriyanagi]|uniref:Uncharacterized protein n=1 Tax=Salix koriyanagi TaxID=2511006 RepID=A0A9Q1A857_9ROSI|nr:hypothetical protein OIU74_024131 [Salix koriyanagi]